MVKLFAADITKLSDETALAERLRGERALEYARMKAERPRRQCLAAGLLTAELVGDGEVRKNEFGKPYIRGAAEFSLSHSGDIVLLALAPTAVGADIEKRSDRDVSRIARRVFTEEERLFMTNAADARRAFFDLWTRKESYMKAVGRGFDMPMESFSVIADENGKMRGVESGFVFFSADIEGYSAAVCTREDGISETEWITF